VEKSGPKFWSTSVIYQLPKENNRQFGENSTNRGSMLKEAFLSGSLQIRFFFSTEVETER
jgi:hypothetical protein